MYIYIYIYFGSETMPLKVCEHWKCEFSIFEFIIQTSHLNIQTNQCRDMTVAVYLNACWDVKCRRSLSF